MRFVFRCRVVVVVLAFATVEFCGCNRRGLPSPSVGETAAPQVSASNEERQILELNEQARKNLKLTVKVARPTDFWRTITIPGVVEDRPGISDRGVASPAVGVVSEVHVFPGDTVRPGERLVTLRLFSEYLQATQTQLFNAAHESKLVQQQINRLDNAAVSGAVSEVRLIELKNDQQRQNAIVIAATQELLNRGLKPEQINAVSEGRFVSTVEVLAPPPQKNSVILEGLVVSDLQASGQESENSVAYEVQSMAVDLGQTVQAGERLVSLANHQRLYVVGHAFKREAGLLEQAARTGTVLQIEFAEDAANQWPLLDQQFQIRHLANTIDTDTRTFDFFVPLTNQSRAYEKDGTTFLAWRFRPGQRTRIEVPVEKFTNVFVLPADAIVRDGPDAFVYRQNGDLFNQIAVHVIHEDRRQMVIANDGSITPSTYLVQNSAASLRRVLKAQAASGAQPGVHVHADGSVHAAH
jgi:membrane fusion protein, heavy metal efflux system